MKESTAVEVGLDGSSARCRRSVVELLLVGAVAARRCCDFSRGEAAPNALHSLLGSSKQPRSEGWRGFKCRLPLLSFFFQTGGKGGSF